MGMQKTRARHSVLLIATLLASLIAVPSSYATAVETTWTGYFSNNWFSGLNWQSVFPPLPDEELSFSSFYTKPIPGSIFSEMVPVHSYSSNNNYPYTLRVFGMTVAQNYNITGKRIQFSPTGFGLYAYFLGCETVTRDTVIDLDIELLAQTDFDVNGGCGYWATLGGMIDGAYGINKIGTGGLKLDGVMKLFTGSININAGTLSVDVITFADAAVVNSGATLRGGGVVHNITVKGSGALYPGSGDLSCIGNATFEPGSIYRVDIARPGASTDAEKLLVGAGSVALGSGTTVFDPVFLMTPPPSQTYTIIEGANAVTGYFSGLPEGGTGVAGEISYQITYQGGSGGNDVVLTVLGVPTATDTTIESQDPSYDYGEDPLVLLEVTARSGSNRPCGSAEYSLDGLPFATCSLSLGGTTMSKCQVDLINPHAGTHTLTASYPGCLGFGPSYQELTSAFTVDMVFPTTNLSSSADPISVGDPVTFTFEALTAPGGANVPTGAVIFKDNGTELTDCRQGLDETGTAICLTSLAESGLRTISVEYGGDNDYHPVTRNLQGGLTVNGPPSFTSADNTIFIAGTTGDFTVTTTGYPFPSLAASGTLPNGVSFTDNGDGTATLDGAPATSGAKGDFPLSITADNGINPDAVQNFTPQGGEA